MSKSYFSYCVDQFGEGYGYERHDTAESAFARVAEFLQEIQFDGITDDTTAEWGEVRAVTVMVEAGRGDWEGEKNIQLYDYQIRPLSDGAKAKCWREE